jgi:DNA polymerase-3 subunit delta
VKVYPDKLEAQLSRSVSPIYIVSGDEPLLIQEACDIIRSSLRKQGFGERQVYHIDASFDWDQVLFNANSMSLFADKKLLELRMPGGKPGVAGAKALTSYAGNLSEENVLLLVTDRLDPKTQQAKWFKVLESAGTFVQVWPIDINQLPNWIQDRMSRVGLSAERDAAQLLADRVEGNLLAAVQEIELLRVVCTDGRVTLQQVIEGVSDSARYSVFSMLDAALSGNSRRTITMLRGLRSEGFEMLPILGALARELRILGGMAGKVRTGQTVNSVVTAARVWQQRRKAVEAALNRHTADALETMLARVSRIDQLVKGLGIGAPWDELEALLLILAGARLVTDKERS